MIRHKIFLPISLICFFTIIKIISSKNANPIVINTWAFTEATSKAWDTLQSGGSALDAVEAGGSTCEELQCDGTVGYGGSPDENGETTLDAMIMDGDTMNMGAVAGLRSIKNAISVARHVLEKTKHSFLVGDLATQFAVQMGFIKESLTTSDSKKIWLDWHKNACQPNFWINVHPDPKTQCGPYKPNKKKKKSLKSTLREMEFGNKNHDTIGIIAIDNEGKLSAGTSTNGARHKIPGRVGDSPIPGAGAYVDSQVGGAAATGDGDVMMRFLPSFLAVEEMRRGRSPNQAAEEAIKRIIDRQPDFQGGVIALNNLGVYGAACHGIEFFPVSIISQDFKGVVKYKCLV